MWSNPNLLRRQLAWSRAAYNAASGQQLALIDEVFGQVFQRSHWSSGMAFHLFSSALQHDAVMPTIVPGEPVFCSIPRVFMAFEKPSILRNPRSQRNGID
jgi:hypothetical protein